MNPPVARGHFQHPWLTLACLLTCLGPQQGHSTGLHSADMSRVVERHRKVVGDRATIELERHQDFSAQPGTARWDEFEIEALVRHYLNELEPEGVRSVVLLGRAARALPAIGARRGDWVPLNELLPEPEPVPRRPWEAAKSQQAPPPPPPPGTVSRQGWTGQPAQGALFGRSVYVSAGHGWYWSEPLGRWATQRGNTHNIVEDLVNSEAINHYLLPMLRNAGAKVVTVREHDLQREMVVVDDDDPAPAGGKGGYQETGSFKPGTGKGFANGKAPYIGSANPFTLGSYRATQVVQGKPTATALFVPAFSKSGLYSVHVGYTSGANRSKDAHFEIRHSGGSSHRRLDMTRHGQTWAWLGNFHFQAGVDPSKGAVMLHNDTEQGAKDKYVIADVVRFGGGEGLIVRGNGKPPTKGPTSGKPRWEECSRYHAQYSGAPPTVWNPSSGDNNDDVTTRSRFAAWHHEQGEDAVFVSWHTNAPNPGRGTSTYVYGPNPPNGSYQFTGTKGSDALGKVLQKTLVEDIRAVFDPKWKDRGVRSAWFGEIDPKHNPEMPAALVEAAFHSTKADADFLREPRFRHLLARAFYKAIVRYFAARDGVPVKLLPEPPRGLRLQVTGPDSARFSWQPGPSGAADGDPATSWLVQRSADGMGFNDGEVVKGTHVDLELDGPGEPLFVRVLAVNEGGISLPSAVLGASSGCGSNARALVVQGFTRLHSTLMPVDNLKPWGLGTVQRLRQWRMNRFDYAIEHVRALSAAGLSVDGVEREALADWSAGDLSTYGLVDWAAGEQSTVDVVWTDSERKLLAGWLQGGAGRAMLANGAEIAWAVDHKGNPASGDWLATWFGAAYADDDAGTYKFSAAPGSVWGAFSAAFDDGSQHSYDVNFPDVLALEGASSLLEYSDGKGVAATGYLVGGARTTLVGFPLETVFPESARHELVAGLVSWLAVQPEPKTCPSSAADDSSEGDTGMTADSGGADGGGEDASDSPGADMVSADGRALDVTAPGLRPNQGSNDGCGCRAAGGAAPGAGHLLLIVGLLVMLVSRRRAALTRRCSSVHANLAIALRGPGSDRRLLGARHSTSEWMRNRRPRFPEHSMHRATLTGLGTLAIATILVGLTPSCADAPSEESPGLQLWFAPLDAACPNTSNGSGSVPDEVSTLAVVLTPKESGPITQRKSRSEINKTGFWEIIGLDVTEDMDVQVYGCDGDGKITWAGRSTGAAVVDQKESTVRVFLAPVAKLVCTGGVDAKANDGQGHLYQPVSLAGAAMLDGGDSVITGGLGSWSGADSKGLATQDTALYDHHAGFFRKGPSLKEKRAMHHAHGLDARHVLVVGGVTSLDLQSIDLFGGALLAPSELAKASPKIGAELIDVGTGEQSGSVKASPAETGAGTQFLSSSIDLGTELLFAGGVDDAGKGTKTLTRLSSLADVASGGKGKTKSFDMLNARAGPALLAYQDGATVIWGGPTSKSAADMGEWLAKGGKSTTKLKIEGAEALTGDVNLPTYGVAAAVVAESGDKLWFAVAGGQPFAQATRADQAPAYLVVVDRKKGTATLKSLKLSTGNLRGGVGTAAARLPSGEVVFAGGLLAPSKADACTGQTECLINDIHLLSAPADLSAETVTLNALMPSGQLGDPGFGVAAVPLPSGVLLVGGQTTVLPPASGVKALEATGRLVTGAPPADKQAGICGK